MGGVYSSTFKLNTDGYGVFEGDISLDNKGGFSSVHYNATTTVVKKFTKIIIKLKGDSENYQVRIRTNVWIPILLSPHFQLVENGKK